MLQFDPVEHVYTYGGIIVPSVTTVIQAVNLGANYQTVEPSILARAAAKGTAVHLAIEEYCTGRLNFGNITEEHAPYLEAYFGFEEKYKPVYLANELQLYHPQWQYAGTIDAICEIKGKIYVVDFKTSYQLHKGPVQIQLAAYRELCEKQEREISSLKVDHVAALHLKKDGTHRLVVMDNPEALKMYLYALMIYRWQQQHK